MFRFTHLVLLFKKKLSAALELLSVNTPLNFRVCRIPIHQELLLLEKRTYLVYEINKAHPKVQVSIRTPQNQKIKIVSRYLSKD